MEKTIYVDPRNAPEVAAVGRRAFPSYSGRKFKIRAFSGPMELRSYWDGGSRDTYAFTTIGGAGPVASVYSNHPVFERGRPHTIGELPPGFALVEHSVFCGKDMGLTIYVRPEDFNRLALPPAEELTADEQVVLEYTRRLKNTYGGRTNIRFEEAHREHGITAERWEAAKTALTARGLLNRAGAITTAGRNAAGSRY